jgi:prepilin peptidase CpaA
MIHLAMPLKIALAVLVLLAAFNDIRSRTVPNALTVTGVVCGVLLQTSLNHWAGTKASLFGLAVGLALFLPLFLLRGMGGGDVKLMAAIGSMAGPTDTIVIFILTAVFGGVLAVALLLWKGGLGRALRNTGVILGELVRLRAPHDAHPELTIDDAQAVKLPYAVAIAMGTLAFLVL